MSKLVPTILVDNRENFDIYLKTYTTFADEIQIDICDGFFVPTKTISLSEIPILPEHISFDFHMMVTKPSDYLTEILRIKPSLCIFHAECNENLLPIFQQLKSSGIKTGVAILKETFPGKIKPYLDVVDHILVFAGKLGQQGGEADMLQTEKIPIIKNINSTLEIGWDGGVNMQNIRALAHNEVDIINVGSALSQSQNPSETYKSLVDESDKTGVLF